MLTICDRVLLPWLSSLDKVDGDMLPVVIMAIIHSKWITSSLEPVPEMPGEFEEVSAADDLVVDWGIRIELFTYSIVVIGCFVRKTISLRFTIKSYPRSEIKVNQISQWNNILHLKPTHVSEPREMDILLDHHNLVHPLEGTQLMEPELSKLFVGMKPLQILEII